jgi:hypothetical protein
MTPTATSTELVRDWTHDGTTPTLSDILQPSETAFVPSLDSPADAIMAWATDPKGMDWALIERYEDWDDPDES